MSPRLRYLLRKYEESIVYVTESGGLAPEDMEAAPKMFNKYKELLISYLNYVERQARIYSKDKYESRRNK